MTMKNVRRMTPMLAFALAQLAPATMAGAKPSRGPSSAGKATQIVYVGTRAEGETGGITAARFDPTTGTFARIGKVADVVRPTWLLAGPHRNMLYSVSEIGNDGKAEAAVYSFRADPATGKLTQISRVGSGGGGATHLAIGGRPSSLFVANYGTGHVAALPLKRGGMLLPAASVMADYGKGTDPVRQAGPHAHGVMTDHSGKYLFAVDLGADRIFVYKLDAARHRLSPARTPFVSLPPGSAPRHMTMSRDGRFLYVLTEATSQVVTYSWDAVAGELTRLSSVPIERAQNRVPGSHAGEITISADGRFLYASNRGEDTIVTFALDQSTGASTEIQRIDVGAKYPTALVFDVTQRWMFIASPGTSSVGVFARDPATGKLTATGQSLSVPMAVTVAVLPR